MKNNRTLISVALLGALTALPLAPARADLIKVGATYNKTFLVTDAGGNPMLGLASSAFTVALGKAGGAQAAVTRTFTEVGGGTYSEALTAADTNTLGALDQTINATGAAQQKTHDQVVGFDPASDLGAAALTTIGATTVSTNTQTNSNGTQINTLVTGQGTILTAINAVPTLSQITNGIFAYTLAGVSFKDHVINTSATAWGTPTITLSGLNQTTVYTINGTTYVTSVLGRTAGNLPSTKSVTLSNQ